MTYLGARGQANALDVLLQAAKIVQDQGYHEIKFVLVGDGPEKPKLIELASELELRNVEFRNPVPKTEVPKVLRDADTFIFNLEKAEVFRYGISSNKLFDYMVAGQPVIFSVSATNDPVKEARCGLTVPRGTPKPWPKRSSSFTRCQKRSERQWGSVDASTWRSTMPSPY